MFFLHNNTSFKLMFDHFGVLKLVHVYELLTCWKVYAEIDVFALQ